MTDAWSIPFTPRERKIIERLQAEDGAQREAGLPVAERTRNVTRETGAFLWQAVVAHHPAAILEIGSSNGLSTMILASAANRIGASVLGTELIPERVAQNNRQLAEAGLADVARVIGEDHRTSDEVHARLWDFVFLDAEKDDYLPHLQAITPYLAPGAVILTDNVISHDCHVFQEFVRASPQFSTFTIPLDRGLEYSVYLGASPSDD
ncbi:MAG: class I SAM-dependent methyltransferase [Thermomicrobiales bacterium]